MKRGRKPQQQSQERGLCCVCDKNKQAVAAKTVLGYTRYSKYCSSCAKNRYGDFSKSKTLWKIKKPHCERCGFIADDPCQLDVHHIDRNNKNNNQSNLQTLCANCHRLEHKEERKIWATLGKG